MIDDPFGETSNDGINKPGSSSDDTNEESYTLNADKHNYDSLILNLRTQQSDISLKKYVSNGKSYIAYDGDGDLCSISVELRGTSLLCDPFRGYYNLKTVYIDGIGVAQLYSSTFRVLMRRVRKENKAFNKESYPVDAILQTAQHFLLSGHITKVFLPMLFRPTFHSLDFKGATKVLSRLEELDLLHFLPCSLSEFASRLNDEAEKSDGVLLTDTYKPCLCRNKAISEKVIMSCSHVEDEPSDSPGRTNTSKIPDAKRSSPDIIVPYFMGPMKPRRLIIPIECSTQLGKKPCLTSDLLRDPNGTLTTSDTAEVRKVQLKLKDQLELLDSLLQINIERGEESLQCVLRSVRSLKKQTSDAVRTQLLIEAVKCSGTPYSPE